MTTQMFNIILTVTSPSVQAIMSQPVGSRGGEEVIIKITSDDLPESNTVAGIYLANYLKQAGFDWPELQAVHWGRQPKQSMTTLLSCVRDRIEDLDYTTTEGKELIESLFRSNVMRWRDVPYIDRIISLRIVPPVPTQTPNPKSTKKRRIL